MSCVDSGTLTMDAFFIETLLSCLEYQVGFSAGKMADAMQSFEFTTGLRGFHVYLTTKHWKPCLQQKRAQQCSRSLCSVRIGDVARNIGACFCWSRTKRTEPLCVVCFGTRSQIYRKSYFSEAEKIATNSRRP